jgi:hypothetical protein
MSGRVVSISGVFFVSAAPTGVVFWLLFLDAAGFSPVFFKLFFFFFAGDTFL